MPGFPSTIVGFKENTPAVKSAIYPVSKRNWNLKDSSNSAKIIIAFKLSLIKFIYLSASNNK